MNDPETKGASMARSAWVLIVTALLMSPANFAVWFQGVDPSDNQELWWLLFTGLTAVQVGLAIAAIVQGVRSNRLRGKGGIVATVLGVLVMLVAPVGWLFGMFIALLSAGGAWGRPLRVRGRQLHPSLRKGSDWTRGAKRSPPRVSVTAASWKTSIPTSRPRVPPCARSR